MGMGALVQLIAKGQQSPITSALQGFTGTAAAMQNLQKQRLANQIQAAQARIAPQAAQANLQKLLLANKIQQAQAGVAPQLAQAGLLQAQAKPGLTQAQTKEALAQAAGDPAKTALTQAQTKKALAEASNVGKAKPTNTLNSFNEWQDSYNQDPHSAKTKVLAAQVRKDMQSSAGTTLTTAPGGGTTVQIGGPAAAASPDTQMAIHPGEALSPTHEVQTQQQVQDDQKQQMQQLFPKTATTAQLSDQKQLGADLKNVGALATTATDHSLPLLKNLRQASNDLGELSGPIVGKAAWASPAGQRLQQLLALKGKDIMATVHNIRNQREFNMVMKSAGTAGMYHSVLQRTFNDALDESYQNILKQDFLKNYMSKGGNSSLEANSLWAKVLTNKGMKNVPDKYLDFNVSGSNRNYKEYAKTIQNLIAKNPKSPQINNLPIVSLIREDILGGK